MVPHRIIILAGLVAWSGISHGQGLEDALQFSQQNIHGSARFNAMGGAFTALGGEMGAVHINPASAGVFTKNELGFTLGIGHAGINSSYYDMNSNAQFGKVNVNNMGIIFSSELDHPDWQMLNFGITYTRTSDFNRRINYTGTQSKHSFAQHLVGLANGGAYEQNDLVQQFPFDVGPAFNSFVIDLVPETIDEYYSHIGVGDTVHQELNIEEAGRSSEFQLTLGTNYQDRLYMGLGLKVGSLVLSRQLDYTETPENQEYIERYHYGSDLEIRGTSYSVSGGLIFRLSDMFRIGASVQTPNFYVNNEFFSTIVDADLAGSYQSYADTSGGTANNISVSPDGTNRYNFKTPWKFTGGIAAVFGPRAILSAEYEYQNYSSGRFRKNARGGSNYQYQPENEDIEMILGGANNIRAGFEYRLLPVSIRAGYAYYQDPVKPAYRDNIDRSIHQFSLGAGLRFEKIYLDTSYYYRMTESRYGLYQSGADLDIAQHGIALTIGVRY